jgi:SNF2 family DNA or RNA helicase
LTGTPIQNRAEDFGALIGFLKVYPFDSPAVFYSNFINLIQKGDNKGIEKLKALVQAISLRRTKESVFGELKLQPRVEQLQPVELNEMERTLYTTVKRSWTYAAGKSESVRNIFQTITKLRQICDHGRDLLSQKALAVLDQGFTEGERMKTIVEDTQLCENCGAVALWRKTLTQTKSLNIFSYACTYFAMVASRGVEEVIQKGHYAQCAREVGYLILFRKMRNSRPRLRIYLRMIWISTFRTARRQRYWP